MHTILSIAAICALGILVYSNTFHSPFQWDEAYFLTGNPAVRNISSLITPGRAAGMSSYSLSNRLVGYLTFALNYRWGGFDVLGYHIVNLAIHLANALLVYFLVLFTFRTPYFVKTGKRQEARGNDPRAKSIAQRPLGHAAKGGGQISEERLRNSSHPMPYALDPMRYSRFFALVVALLFVAHPVQTEAVTYIFQRFASLVALFYLLSLVLYIKGRLRQTEAKGKTDTKEREKEKKKVEHINTEKHNGRPSTYTSPLSSSFSPYSFTCFILSLLCAILAMKTKENAFTLPVVITLYEFLFFRGPIKSRLLRLVPFLLTLLIIPVAVLHIEGSLGEVVKPMAEPTAIGYRNLSPAVYLLTQFRVIVTYLRLLFLPVNQNLVYAYPSYASFFAPPVLASFAFLAFLFGTALWLVFKSRQTGKPIRREQDEESFQGGGDEIQGSSDTMRYAPCALRLISFGILWFFIALSVESSVIPLATVIDEYRLYLPSVGFFLAATSGLFLLLRRSPKMRGSILAAVVLAIVVLLAAAAYARNSLWEDKISLWEDVVKKNPDSPKAYNNLGIAYYEKGLDEDAIAAYRRALSLTPGNFFVSTNLGVAYASSGRLALAVEEFMRAIETEPKNGVAYANLARVYRRLGEFGKAAENYRRAVDLDPLNESAFYGLGTTYATLGKTDEAIWAFTRCVDLDPQNAQAYRNRGLAYARKGNMRSAEADLRKACALGNAESCASLRERRLP